MFYLTIISRRKYICINRWAFVLLRNISNWHSEIKVLLKVTFYVQRFTLKDIEQKKYENCTDCLKKK